MNADRRPTGTVGLAGARQALAAGTAVVLPNPAPLTCVVAGTDPAAVNGAKHRPADQPVALWAHHPDTFADVADALDLDRTALARARHLLTEELLTLLVPLRPAARRPAWLAPASKDGWTLLFGARWQPLRPLLDAFPVLYVSSANRTGHPPAADTAEAVAVFGADTAVLAVAEPPESAVPESSTREAAAAGGPAVEPSARRRATTTLRLHSDGRLTLHRHGAQDHPYPDAAAYLAHLRGISG